MTLPFLPHIETAQRELQREQGERIWCLRRDGVLVACALQRPVEINGLQYDDGAFVALDNWGYSDLPARARLRKAISESPFDTRYSHADYTLALEAHGGGR